MLLTTLLLAAVIVTLALLCVTAGWFLSGKRKKLEKRCGKLPSEPDDSCPPEGCELCCKEPKSKEKK